MGLLVHHSFKKHNNNYSAYMYTLDTGNCISNFTLSIYFRWSWSLVGFGSWWFWSQWCPPRPPSTWGRPSASTAQWTSSGAGRRSARPSVREGVNKKHAPKVLTPPPPVKLVFLCFNLLWILYGLNKKKYFGCGQGVPPPKTFFYRLSLGQVLDQVCW